LLFSLAMHPCSAHETLVSIVDDDVSVCRALRRLVEFAGFTAETFASGREVLDSGLSRGSGCLVIDVHLGDMTGFELYRSLVANGTRPPVIFITAHEDSEAEEYAWRAGAVAYLRKPVPTSAFLTAIERALRDARTLNLRSIPPP